MRKNWKAIGLLLALASPGCVPAAQVGRPVTIVATRTPGVAMVIVRPATTKTSREEGVDRRAHYVLLCDGRGADGMRCDILPEVGADRRSRALPPAGAVPVIDEGVATLSDLSIRYSGDDSVARGTSAAPPAPAPQAAPAAAPPAAPPPTPPPPPAAAPPPPAAPAEGRATP
jgi:hypothetical protein